MKEAEQHVFESNKLLFSSMAPADILAEIILCQKDRDGKDFTLSDKGWVLEFEVQQNVNVLPAESSDNEGAELEIDEPIYQSAKFTVEVHKIKDNADVVCVDIQKKSGSGFLFYDTLDYLRKNLRCNDSPDPTL